VRGYRGGVRNAAVLRGDIGASGHVATARRCQCGKLMSPGLLSTSDMRIAVLARQWQLACARARAGLPAQRCCIKSVLGRRQRLPRIQTGALQPRARDSRLWHLCNIALVYRSMSFHFQHKDCNAQPKLFTSNNLQCAQCLAASLGLPQVPRA
jgi:hypothetical protein